MVKKPVILAIETSSETGSVALGIGRLRTEEAQIREPRTHGRDLMDLIDRLFQSARCTRESLSAVAIDLGPGSYTGLRVGIATAQGIALALNLPCAGFETTEVLARNVSADFQSLAVLIDVRAGEIYYRLFRALGGEWAATDRQGVSEPLALTKKLPPKTPLAGTGAHLYADVFQNAGFPLCDEWASEPRASKLLELAREALSKKSLCKPSDLSAIYPRPSSAEIAFRKAGKR